MFGHCRVTTRTITECLHQILTQNSPVSRKCNLKICKYVICFPPEHQEVHKNSRGASYLVLYIYIYIYVVVQFYPWFKFSFLLFQTHYHVIIIHYHTQKQKKRKFEPRIILNHNIYTRFQKGFHTEKYIDGYILLFSCTCARVYFSLVIVQLVKNSVQR